MSSPSGSCRATEWPEGSRRRRNPAAELRPAERKAETARRNGGVPDRFLGLGGGGRRGGPRCVAGFGRGSFRRRRHGGGASRPWRLGGEEKKKGGAGGRASAGGEQWGPRRACLPRVEAEQGGLASTASSSWCGGSARCASLQGRKERDEQIAKSPLAEILTSRTDPSRFTNGSFFCFNFNSSSCIELIQVFEHFQKF